MANWKIEKRERANIAGLVYYSKYGIIAYESISEEWSKFLAGVLPSELPNVLAALSVHFNISKNETESEKLPEAEAGAKKKSK